MLQPRILVDKLKRDSHKQRTTTVTVVDEINAQSTNTVDKMWFPNEHGSYCCRRRRRQSIARKLDDCTNQRRQQHRTHSKTTTNTSHVISSLNYLATLFILTITLYSSTTLCLAQSNGK